MIQIK
jgi:hypothetical protein